MLQLQLHTRRASDEIRLRPRSRAIRTTRAARTAAPCLGATVLAQARSLGRLKACQRLQLLYKVTNSAARPEKGMHKDEAKVRGTTNPKALE